MNLFFLQKNKCLISVQEEDWTHMATALQAEHAAECGLRNGLIDELGIVTKKGHFGAGLYLGKASEGKEK